MAAAPEFRIRLAQRDDVPTILTLIRELATYERAPNEVVATEEQLRENLFGAHPAAEVLIGEESGEPVCFALFFHNFSTWMGRRGLYLEDFLSVPRCAGKAMVGLCSSGWRRSRASANAAGWNGQSSIGTNRPSNFTSNWAPGLTKSGPSTG